MSIGLAAVARTSASAPIARTVKLSRRGIGAIGVRAIEALKHQPPSNPQE